MYQNVSEDNRELLSLCSLVRQLTYEKEYNRCREAILHVMSKYPDAPEPHNLLGVLLEKEGDHVSAMKHFRAAWALDPTYIPVRHNIKRFGSFYANDKCAFDESDCQPMLKQEANGQADWRVFE